MLEEGVCKDFDRMGAHAGAENCCLIEAIEVAKGVQEEEEEEAWSDDEGMCVEMEGRGGSLKAIKV